MKPCVQVAPLSVEVAKPMSELPPSKKRPDWKTETMVEPKEKVSGSTCVLCWLEELVNGSELIRSRGFLAPVEAKARVAVVNVSNRATVTAMAARARQPEREIACMSS